MAKVQRGSEHGLRKIGRLLIVPAAALAFSPAAGSASAAICDTNANGIAHSSGQVATGASTSACAPAWGRKAGDATGRKAG